MFDLYKEATKKAFTLKVLQAEYTELEWNTGSVLNILHFSNFFLFTFIYCVLLLEFKSIKTPIHARHWNKVTWECVCTLLAFQLVPLTQKEDTLT